MSRPKYKATITKAYLAFLNNEANSSDTLCSALLSFAVPKISSYLKKQDEYSETAEDVAQRVVIKVWGEINKLSGSPDQFFNWFNLKCHSYGLNAHKKAVTDSQLRVPLVVESEELPGTQEDNPVIYKEPAGYYFMADIPEKIQGRDREMVELLRDGKTFDDLARIYEVKKTSIEQWAWRLKEKINAEG